MQFAPKLQCSNLKYGLNCKWPASDDRSLTPSRDLNKSGSTFQQANKNKSMYKTYIQCVNV